MIFKSDDNIAEQRAVLVGFNHSSNRNDIYIQDSMDELRELVYAAGADVMDVIVQNKATIAPAKSMALCSASALMLTLPVIKLAIIFITMSKPIEAIDNRATFSLVSENRNICVETGFLIFID